jgi:hypothetical protein
MNKARAITSAGPFITLLFSEVDNEYNYGFN